MFMQEQKGVGSVFLIGLLVAVAIAGEILHRLNPWKKPEPPYEELVRQIKESDWYQELWQNETYREILANDPHVSAYYAGPYEAQRLLTNRGFQLGLIDYVKTQSAKKER